MKKQAVADYRTDKNTVSALERLGYEVVPTMPIAALYEEVRKDQCRHEYPVKRQK